MSATERPQRNHSRLTTVVLVAACAWFAVAATRATVRHLYARQELAGLEQEIDQMQHGNDRLARSVERMKQPAWLALLARARLNYTRPDETVVFVYKSEKSDTIVAPHEPEDSRPNWRRWWDWAVGDR